MLTQTCFRIVVGNTENSESSHTSKFGKRIPYACIIEGDHMLFLCKDCSHLLNGY